MHAKSIYLWILAVIITLGSAYYQRVTGPSYPLKVKTNIDGKDFIYHLNRSHLSTEDFRLQLPVANKEVKGVLTWKRYKSFDEWTSVPMKNISGSLEAVIPKQPAAGKVMYSVRLISGNKNFSLTDQPVVMRFRGDVPAGILIPHILCMFIMMLLSTRTGLEYFSRVPKYKIFTFLTLAFVIAGGMILGPITQKFAFGEYWTGFPYGYDLTDNKTLIALIAWIGALWGVLKSKHPGRWILFAAIVTLIIFLIPHSVLGSEIDYRKK